MAAACPGVKVAAVVGVFHSKWEERPVLVIERMPESSLSEADVRIWLEPKLVKWWQPDRIIFDEVPLTATGKIDKKSVRARYKECLASS